VKYLSIEREESDKLATNSNGGAAPDILFSDR